MSLNTIYNKLFNKSKKTDLKTAKNKKLTKVELNKIDDLVEMANQSYSNYEYALDEYFYPGQEKIITARDILRFEEPHPQTVQDELDAIKQGLDDLGLDYPDDLQYVQDSIDGAIEKYNELIEQFERLGVAPMKDRI